MIWKDILTYYSIRPATFDLSTTPDQIIIAGKGVPSICLGFLIGPTNYSMTHGWWITTMRKRVLVVARAWDGRAAREVFSFQFSGFEGLAIPPPQRANLVLFLPLKEENFQTFPKIYCPWGLRTHPNKFTVTSSSFYSDLFQRTSGSSLELKSFK
jgi:hypothetical protein